MHLSGLDFVHKLNDLSVKKQFFFMECLCGFLITNLAHFKYIAEQFSKYEGKIREVYELTKSVKKILNYLSFFIQFFKKKKN